MNLTDLHYVVEIDKSGSISKAAKELYVAQPNLSKAIKHLERELEFLSLNGRQRELRRQEKDRNFWSMPKDHLRNRGNEKGLQ